MLVYEDAPGRGAPGEPSQPMKTDDNWPETVWQTKVIDGRPRHPLASLSGVIAMMKKCPDCGSTEIIPDLLVFSDEALTGQLPPYVRMLEPEPAKRHFVWIPKSVATGFRAAVCGDCGHTQLYTQHHAELLAAHKQGYVSQQYALTILAM
jgi:hypothetical protein